MWGKDITGNFKYHSDQCKRIIKATKGCRDSAAVTQYKEASKNLSEIFAQQEVFRKQRLKQLWLKEGDQNNKFFHASAKARRKKIKPNR